MSAPKVLFGFHAVGVRLRTAPKSIVEIYADPSRKDARMRQFLARAQESGVRLLEADGLRLSRLAGSAGHQGVVARVEPLPVTHSLDDLLDGVAGPPLVLVLDGITDPHNLGACLRVADGAGAHAVIAPKDHAVGINATVAKVASGAAETVPYFMVTNLARTLGELKDATSGASASRRRARHAVPGRPEGPLALVLGAEGTGMRQLTRKTCDALVSIPMLGGVESLNVSVASGICLYEAVRQRAGMTQDLLVVGASFAGLACARARGAGGLQVTCWRRSPARATSCTPPA
jgi:23S rRNA (guanosine2251-2'-O)-methyltransferase